MSLHPSPCWLKKTEGTGHHRSSPHLPIDTGTGISEAAAERFWYYHCTLFHMEQIRKNYSTPNFEPLTPILFKTSYQLKKDKLKQFLPTHSCLSIFRLTKEVNVNYNYIYQPGFKFLTPWKFNPFAIRKKNSLRDKWNLNQTSSGSSPY